MGNGWIATLEQILHSPTLPMWMTLAAAGFFAIVLLITLARAERTVANGALTVITLLAVGIAVAATVRKFGSLEDTADALMEVRPVSQSIAAVPALSCLDGLAGEGVEAACERSLFASADVTAAAVSYTAAQLSRLAPLDRASAQASDQQVLRKTLERDRYGFVAQVLAVRDLCTESECKSFELFADPGRIKTNIRERTYDNLVGRYVLAWAAPAAAASAPTSTTVSTAGLPPSVPSGKPTTIDFPSAASIPPVNIMTTEPPPTTAAPKPAQTPPPPMKPAPAAAAPTPLPPVKKQTATSTAGAPKRPAAAAPPPPMPLAAPAAADDN